MKDGGCLVKVVVPLFDEIFAKYISLSSFTWQLRRIEILTKAAFRKII